MASRDDIIIEQSNSTRTALLFANIGGSSLCAIDVGGSFGRDLSAQGEQAMAAFAKEWITKLFGSEVAAAVIETLASLDLEYPEVGKEKLKELDVARQALMVEK